MSLLGDSPHVNSPVSGMIRFSGHAYQESKKLHPMRTCRTTRTVPLEDARGTSKAWKALSNRATESDVNRPGRKPSGFEVHRPLQWPQQLKHAITGPEQPCHPDPATVVSWKVILLESGQNAFTRSTWGITAQMAVARHAAAMGKK